MATGYTSILKLALPVSGELTGTWGDTVNDEITQMVEQAVAGRAVINTWTANSHTLTTANGATSESRCAIIYMSDTGVQLSGAGTCICPTATKIYLVTNATGQTITFKTSGGTGVAFANSDIKLVFCDGTNVVDATPAGGIAAVVDDTSPQLGGNLDMNGQSIDAGGTLISETELSYLNAATSNIQTQLDSKIAGNQTITLSGDVSGSGTTSISVTVADDSHNHIIANVDGLQTALDGKPSLTGGTVIGNATFNDNVTFGDSYTETVYNLSGTAIDPANGTIQTKTLSSNTTLTDSVAAGQSVTLMIDDGLSRTITWPSITWLVSGGSAPTLETTGYTVIVLWKVGSTLYGKY